MRRTRLKEINVIQKSIHDIQWRIGLVYPNSYSIGMSGLTVKLLYHLLNQHRNIFTERIFFSASFPGPPRSIETGRTLTQFDLLAFTFQFELDYINALQMLLRSNIPVYSKDRTSDHPLLIAGGPTVTTNPEPLLNFVDVIFSGELETISYKFLEAIIASKHSSLMEEVLSVPGFYSSQDSGKQVTPIITSNLDDVNYPTAQVRPISGQRERKGVLDGYFLQVARGCIHGCHFCLIGRIFRPQRDRSFDRLCNLIDKGSRETETNFFSLIGSSTADYSQIKELLNYLLERKHKFSLPSIRVDSGFEVLEIISRSGLRSLSIAPESASDEVRFKIGKKISNSQIYNFIQKAEQNQIQELKLYFILGLTSDPVSESHEIVGFLNNLAGSCSSLQLNVSITPLIPKHGTKLENLCVNYREIQTGFTVLKQEMNRSIRQKKFPAHWAAVQAILSIGGRELTPIMIDIADDGGSYQSWKKNLEVEPIDYYLEHYCF
ncbi:MAG: radical SAM protein [Candidatus Heimdallarchaeota archaeon]|nr:MAG: radical SAM protein [Candidatus Heimdallarchaeota archaeon]